MKSHFKALLLLVTISLFLGGCATNRGVLDLDVPDSASTEQPNGKSVYINSVTDNRIFEQNPATPDIPSLGFGGSESASAELKHRAIARKRNSYGKALGDILLPENRTVESVITDSLVRSLSELGYVIVENQSDITDETIIIDTSIEKFWSWMNPGFWALTLTSEIETNISISSPESDTKKIQARTEGKFQIANTSSWTEIMMLNLEKYNEEVKEQF
ncbi:hypothetical protein [Nitrincola sp. MINF-07-Sa-05]|uniref:hypothetical protein n=1 Tax=Nitrincola salilacus TaxID=3400273 RepID=UPI003917E44E